MTFERDGIVQYSVEELKGILLTGQSKVIDVRTHEEYNEGHIPNVPLYPMQEMESWVSGLLKDESYVCVCRSGGRSQRVAEYLKAQGFDKVANFDGGMLVWNGDLEA